MRPEIIPFAPEHLLAFEWRENVDFESSLAWSAEMRSKYTFAAFSGRVGEKIIGIAGLYLLGRRQAYAQAILSDEIGNHRVWFHREIRRGFRRLVHEHCLQYVTAWVKEDSERNCRWIEALGFSRTVERIVERGRPLVKYQMGIL